MSNELIYIGQTLHISDEDAPRVGSGPGFEFRILHGRLAEQLVVSEFRTQPFVESPPHRHVIGPPRTAGDGDHSLGPCTSLSRRVGSRRDALGVDGRSMDLSRRNTP